MAIPGEPTRIRSSAEVAYSLLAKATFGTILYGFVGLLAAVQRLLGYESGPPPPMSPFLAVLTTVISLGLVLLLPLLILLLLLLGYYGLVHMAMLALKPTARESVWVARRWFLTFWALGGMAVLFFFASGGAMMLAAPELVRLSLYMPVVFLPSAVVAAFVLFLGHAVWGSLPPTRRSFLTKLVWADVLLMSAAAAGGAVLTGLAWREIEMSGTLAPVYSPWTTIPSGVLNLGTLVALYLAFRWARRHPPLREGWTPEPLPAWVHRLSRQ